MYLSLDSFPLTIDELVPQNLLRTCAFVKESKWEEIGVVFGIGLDDVEEIGDSTSSNVARICLKFSSRGSKGQNPQQ